ncbi:MAG: hypothetical protein IKZ87_01270 [Actinomycetaceae bacterium]|nr:hypothetical protein [Actinomycetaceae bacterium]
MEETNPTPTEKIWEEMQKQLRQALGVPQWIDMVYELVPKALKEAYEKGYEDALAVIGNRKSWNH